MSSIKEDMRILVSLQEKELAIRRIESDLAGVDERISALSEELSSYQKGVAEQEQKLSDTQKAYRSDEEEVKMIEVQIGKSKEKLSAVKTNKEYQSMLKEIDELNEKSSGIEDRMLADLDRIEIYEKELIERRADLTDAQAEIDQKRDGILQKSEQQRTEMDTLKRERDGIWEAVGENLKGIYEKVKQQSNGIAVAAIVDGICQVCRINIPPQLFNEVMRMDSMRMCPNCQRIMYPKVVLEEEQQA